VEVVVIAWIIMAIAVIVAAWAGRPAVSFDYSCMTRSGDSTQTHYLSVVAFTRG